MLQVDGISLTIGMFDEREQTRVILPLARLVREKLANLPSDKRLLLGICGPPGSGKSVFAARLAGYLIKAGLFAKDEIACLPMDGYHFPNATLERRVYRGENYPGMDGCRLRAIKGAPETFDAGQFAGDLAQCRDRTQSLSLPAYCRIAHEPRPGQIPITPRTRLLLVEGNYLLLEENGWKGIRETLDLCVYLSVPTEQCKANLLARQIRGGREASSALEHIARVDMINLQRVEASRGRSDYDIKLADNMAIEIRSLQDAIPMDTPSS